MKHYKQHITFLLLAAGLLAGCAHEEELTLQNEIAVTTGVTGMSRRAPGISTPEELQSQDLRIDAYFHDTETKYLNGTKLHYATTWKFWSDEKPGEQVHYYWPIDGAVYTDPEPDITDMSLDFVGYCPYTQPAYIGTPTYNHATGVSFTCDMSSYMTLANQSSFPEFLVALLDSQTLAKQTAAGGAIPLHFKHSLAQIKFTITEASGSHVQIDSIGISDLYTSGTCAYNGTTLSWTSLSGSAGISIKQTLKRGGAIESTPFFVIPANYGSKYLTVKSTWDDWSDVTISNYGTNVDFNWSPGCSYTYNLTLDSLGLKVDIHKFTEQW